MSDLISRKALLKAVEKEENECENSGILPNWFSVSGIINRQPIAYDVDKVVERLENEPSCGFGFKGLYTKRVIEIVKGAVKDE